MEKKNLQSLFYNLINIVNTEILTLNFSSKTAQWPFNVLFQSVTHIQYESEGTFMNVTIQITHLHFKLKN